LRRFSAIEGIPVPKGLGHYSQGHFSLKRADFITGFSPGLATGSTDVNNGTAATAKADIQNSYNIVSALSVGTDPTRQNLGNKVLLSGVYGFAASGGLTGSLTLDAQGNPNVLFVFKFGSDLTTATASLVILINGA
jgi:hypothetical protein